jgi:hypothetical protein
MTNDPNPDVFHKVAERLSRICGPQYRSPITYDTEVYHDLNIYGDALVFDLLLWLRDEFGVEPNLHIADYGPSEWHSLTLWWPWLALRRLWRRNEPKYKSLKVREIVAAVEAKRWPDDAQFK